jgi:hypothetical protein
MLAIHHRSAIRQPAGLSPFMDQELDTSPGADGDRQFCEGAELGAAVLA